MKLKLNYLIIFLLFSSCVEHIFYIDIKPNGNFNINYQCKGDLEDITNYDFFVPNLSDWEITSSFEEKNGTYYFSSNKNYTKNELVPENFISTDSIPYTALVKHPININKSNFFFFQIINFKCTFKSRQVNIKYPKLYNWINNPKNQPEGMIKEILNYLFEQAINDCQLGFNIYPIIKNDINNWFKNNVNHLQDSVIFNNFDDYLIQGSNIIKTNLLNNYVNIDSIINIYKKEVDITTNLIDDDFNIQIKIPNNIFSHNSDTIIDGILHWDFSINDFLINDKKLYAYSYEIFYLKFLLFFISIIFIIIIKKKYILFR